MKKKLLFCLGLLFLGGISILNLYNSRQIDGGEIGLTDMEAMAFCEVTKKGKTLLKCEGRESCSTKYMGYELTCDGQKVSD